MNDRCKCLSVCAFGVAIGVYSALCLLVLGWLAWLAGGFGAGFVTMAGSYYIGYHASFIGGLIGVIWGFIHGFIAGAIVAWVYNLCLKCACCKKQCTTETKPAE